MRVLISVLKAVSTVNQAQLIRKLIESKGFEVEFKTTITLDDLNDVENYAFLWFTIGTVQYAGDAVVPYLFTRKPRAVYVTVEGLPTRGSVIHTNMTRLDFIANSYFTAKCLKQVGLRVIDVVHHAIDEDLSTDIFQNKHKLREKLCNWLGEKAKDKVIFLCVSRHDPRKALNKLAHAVRILNEGGVKDFLLLMLTDMSARKLFQNLDNVIFIANFGGLSFKKVLEFMSACDYTVFPSVCEGFGLPVLESMSVGTPVLHNWMPPLKEFSSTEFNFVWDYEEEKLVQCGHTQYWIFHDYPPEYLAEMMEWAIDVRKNHKEDYENYSQSAYEHAKHWDYRKVYPKLLRYLGIR